MMDSNIIVAIGASAGGLEALQSFLSNFPDIDDLSIIVAQHLSPTHKSRLSDLLSRETNLDVREAKDGDKLKEKRVYITPPDKQITVQNGLIVLTKALEEVGPKPSVSILFESLASYQPTQTIGVILSGTGSDGATGVKALKKAGGYILAQEPQTAKYDGMPLSAIQTGLVDSVTSPDNMGNEIKEFIETPAIVKPDSSDDPENPDSLKSILGILSARTGTDFFHYKKATIGRRLDKRMAMVGVNSLEDYLKILERDKKEVDELFKIILIGVTSFYRDPKSFEILLKKIKEIIDKKEAGDKIRIWVPACSTGEEAYTYAIELHRMLGEDIVHYDIQIFATDIDEKAISFARKAIYSKDVLKNVDSAILEEYFQPVKKGLQLRKSVRSLVLFSKHDVLNNAPFLKLDLISCRNLLIYFDRTLQDEVIPIFHYALKPGAILFLGKSETVGHFSELFVTVNGTHKIYSRKSGKSLKQFSFSRFRSFNTTGNKNDQSAKPKEDELSTSDKVKETIYKTFDHPYVVIDESFTIQKVSGDLRLFLTLPSGDMQANLIKMVNKELQIEVRSICNKSIKNREVVRGSVKRFTLFGQEYFVRFTVKPLLYTSDDAELFIVVFESLDLEEFIDGNVVNSTIDFESARIQELEHELALTKEQLQSYIEELETSNEELQSLNEELQSANEELQSTNEELETSNEELQSTNEEVQIAYQELKSTTEELEKKELELKRKEADTRALLNNDLQAFLLIDKAYKILSYNTKARKIFENLSAKRFEVGSSFIDILPSSQVQKFIKNFEKPLNGEKYSYTEKIEGLDQIDRWYNISYDPVQVDESSVEGISIAVQDITELKKTTSKLNAAERLVNSVFDATTTGICITDKDGKFVDVNNKYCEIYGYTKEELIGNNFTMMVKKADRKKLQKLHDEFIEGGEEIPAEFDVVTKEGKNIVVASSAQLLVQDDGTRYKITSVRDITEQKFNQEQLEVLSKNLPGVLFQYRKRPNGSDELIHVTERSESLWGFKPEKCIENIELIWNNFHKEDLNKVLKSIEESAENMDYWTSEWRYHHPDGKTYWQRGSGHPRKEQNGDIIWDSIVLDITKEKEREFETIRTKNNQSALINSTDDYIWSVNSTYELVSCNQAFKARLKEILGREVQEGDYVLSEEFGTKDIKKWKSFYDRALKGEHVNEISKSSGTGNQKSTYDRISFNPIIHEDTIIGVACFVKDITEETIQRRQLDRAVEVADLGYWELNLETKEIFWSDEVYRIWETKKSFQPTLENLKKTIHPDDLDEFLENHEKALSGEVEHDVVHRIIVGENKVKWVHEKGELTVDEDGDTIAFSGTVQDVTEQKEEEQHLKLLESVVTEADDAVLITEAEPLDKPGPKIIYVNEAFTKMTGYESKEVIGKSPRILQGPKSNYDKLKKMGEALRKWQPYELTTLNYKKNGDEFWINFRVIPVKNEKGWYTHWIAIERDVTKELNERKQKEVLVEVGHILSSELEYISAIKKVTQTLIDNLDVHVAELWLIDEDAGKINLTAGAEKDEGYKEFHGPDEHHTFKKGEGLPGQVWEKQEVLLWNDLNKHKKFKRKKAAKSSRIKSAYGIPISFNEEIIGVILIGMNENIRNKESFHILKENFQNYLGGELKRKEMQEQLKLIYDTAPDLISIIDVEGYFKTINKSAEEILGYSIQELQEKPFIEFVHTEDREKTKKEFEGLLEGNETIYFENRYMTKQGDYKWLAWTAKPELDKGFIFSVAKDITESKRLKNLLDEATSIANIGGWEVNLLTGQNFWSDITKNIHEVPQDFEPDLETAIEFYKEGEDREKIRQVVENAIDNGEPFDVEVQLITYKGNEKWVRAVGRPHYVDGKCVRLSGSFEDIDERKKAELNALSALKEKEQILSSINDGFFSVNNDWTVTYWNDSAAAMIGVKKEEVIGENFWDVFEDAIDTEFYDNYHKALESKEPIYFEGFYDQLKMWVDVAAYPTSEGLSVYFKDITDKKVDLEEIKLSKERFEVVTKATHDAIWDWDLVNNHVYWGQGFNTLFGYQITKEEQDVESWTNNIHPDDYEEITEDIHAAIENPEVNHWEAEYRYRKADGEYLYVIDRGYLIRDGNGKAIRMVGAMTDITEQKEYEESLERINRELDLRARELAASNAELEQFAYVASHDLQEPLRMVTGFLTQLEKKYADQLDDKAKQYIDFAVDGGKRMRQIILDLLEYSRVGKTKEDSKEVDLNEVVDEVTQLFRKLIADTKAKIEVEDLPVVEGFESPYLQIFQNLIDNALKYRSPDRDPEISITCKDQGEKYHFIVKDNGIGIEEEYLENVFIIFKRMHTQDEIEGTGMGLSIVKKIIENMGGEIWISSEYGKGSEFHFTIPKT